MKEESYRAGRQKDGYKMNNANIAIGFWAVFILGAIAVGILKIADIIKWLLN